MKSKKFYLDHAEGLLQTVTVYARNKKNVAFEHTVRKVHISKISMNANVITNHIIYKVKKLGDGEKIVKARIAPHGNINKDKTGLKTKPSLQCMFLLPLVGCSHFL